MASVSTRTRADKRRPRKASSRKFHDVLMIAERGNVCAHQGSHYDAIVHKPSRS